jgi:predicted enzyme related to lactoylglutathione lyase
MPRVVHFEIHADNPERAIAFYQGIFGWSFQKWAGPMDYWLIGTGSDEERGINGGMVRRKTPLNAGIFTQEGINAYCCTVQVPAIDEYIGKIIAAGGPIVVPKMPIPGIGWLAYFKDTEGNIVGVMQPDAMAK